MREPSKRKQRERHSGPPCPHNPAKFKTEAAHLARNASRLRNHKRMMASSLDYRLRAILRNIVQRCNDPRFVGYKYYGGKGVHNFLKLSDLKFLWKRDGADKMKRASIDRLDSNGHYELSNVRFIPLADNIRRANRSNKGKRLAPRFNGKPARFQILAVGPEPTGSSRHTTYAEKGA